MIGDDASHSMNSFRFQGDSQVVYVRIHGCLEKMLNRILKIGHISVELHIYPCGFESRSDCRFSQTR